MKNHIKKYHKKYSGVIVTVLVGFFGIVGAFAVPDSYLPNTRVGQTFVGGFTQQDAEKQLDIFLETYRERQLTLAVAGKAYTFGLDELGVKFDTKSSTEQVEAVAKGSAFNRFAQLIDAFFNPNEYKLVVYVDTEKMQKAVVNKVPDLDDPEIAQARFFVNGLNEELDSKIGYPADYKKLEREVVESVKNFRASPIEVSVLARDDTSEPGFEVALDEDVRVALESKEARLIALTINLVALTDVEKNFTVPISENQDWFKRSLTIDGWKVDFDEEKIRTFLEKEVVVDVNQDAQNAEIKSLPEEGKLRAVVEGMVRSGYKLDLDLAVAKVVESLEKEVLKVELPIERVDGKVINSSGVELGALKLLSVGRSNFAGSPAGRDFNVRKALNEKYNNILLAPGETFSYNKLLDGPVTNGNGWKNSLAIFGGGASLRQVPGGGLCQVSTTVYRAAVYAGLDIKSVKNHSLYVHYYVAHGEGLDATIYPGQQDLSFVNDTGGYIFIQSYAVGDDAYVSFFGTSDGRKVTLDGPLRYNEVPAGTVYEKYGSPFRANDIIWFQKIEYADGNVKNNQLVSRYAKSIPKKKS